MPKVVDHAERIREIAYATWFLIARRGIEGVTMRAVATEAGVSVGRIQHYFDSKDDLVRRACALLVDEADRHVGGQLAELAPLERIRLMLHHTIPVSDELTAGNLVWWSYLLKSRDDEVIGATVRDAQAGSLELMTTLVAEAREAGELATGPPARSAALRLLARSEGYAARVLTGSLSAAEALAELDAELAELATRRAGRG